MSLIQDGDYRIIIDPGMAPSQDAIARPLQEHELVPSDITDVIVSHHHPDHTINVGMFPHARVHDHWAVYHYDEWTSRPAEGFRVSPSVLLWETPGHTPQDISTLITTDSGLVVASHLWFYEAGPVDDPFATDLAACHANRDRVLEVADLIVPGHGAPFVPGPDTPR